VIRDSAVKHTPQELFDPHRSLIVSIFAQSVAPSVGPATNSPVQTESITTKPCDLLFCHDKRERDDTTPGTPENAPLTNRASTSNNPEPMISPGFVEANYEVLESLLREDKRLLCNKDLRTELEYFSEECDEEREMELRPTRAQEGSKVQRNIEGGRPSEQRAEDNGLQEMNLPPLLTAHLGRMENGQPLPLSL
ncbi:hypothetical protein Tco_1038004, partial [Tanacetum coccineum]